MCVGAECVWRCDVCMYTGILDMCESLSASTTCVCERVWLRERECVWVYSVCGGVMYVCVWADYMCERLSASTTCVCESVCVYERVCVGVQCV